MADGGRERARQSAIGLPVGSCHNWRDPSRGRSCCPACQKDEAVKRKDAPGVLLRNLLDFVVYIIVRVFIATVQALPIRTCQRYSGTMATLFCDVLKLRRKVVDGNLRQAYPHLSPAERHRLAWRMWEHLFLMVAEIAHTQRKIHFTNWHKHIRLRGAEGIVRALLERRATMILTGHFGNFEIAGYVIGLFGFPTYTVARPLDNQYLDRFLNRFRGSTGQYIIPKGGAGPQVEKLLREGKALTVLCDQSAGGKHGVWVDFFGRPASTHKAIALFSLGSGAPMLVTYCRRLEGPLQFEVGLEGVADPATAEPAMRSVEGLTQWYTDRVESFINRAPEQYWWVHRRWKGHPPQQVPDQRAA